MACMPSSTLVGCCSTLLDVIAGRKTIGRIEGDIFVDGRPKEQNTWARMVGYVEQVWFIRSLVCTEGMSSCLSSLYGLFARPLCLVYG